MVEWDASKQFVKVRVLVRRSTVVLGIIILIALSIRIWQKPDATLLIQVEEEESGLEFSRVTIRNLTEVNLKINDVVLEMQNGGKWISVSVQQIEPVQRHLEAGSKKIIWVRSKEVNGPMRVRVRGFLPSKGLRLIGDRVAIAWATKELSKLWRTKPPFSHPFEALSSIRMESEKSR